MVDQHTDGSSPQSETAPSHGETETPGESAGDASAETSRATLGPESEKVTRRSFLHRSGAFATTAAFASGQQGLGKFGDAGDESDADADCTVRTFTVHAVDVDIVYNRYGQHQPHGAMYVLEENLDAAREASGETPDDAFDELPGSDRDDDEDEGVDTSVIQPLVIRANEGDIIEIEFVNDLERYASIHQTALPYEIQTSDGMAVGFNEDTTVPPGESRQYRWYATHQGTHYFRDGVSQAFDSTPHGNPENVNNLARGLFGAVVVEPEGATWTDPKTGGELRSGVRADIHDPDGIGTSYREFVAFYHDPGHVQNADGSEPTHPNSDEPQGFHGINYRGDQTGSRLQNRQGCEDCEQEVGFYSSWIHGDPGGGDSVYEAYQGDPVKMCVVGANLEENHSHHLHNHRWKEIPGRTDSDTIDAQSVGPGTTYETYLTIAHGGEPMETSSPELTWKEAFEAGVGELHGTAGDLLFHCHLFPHYAEGMNSLVRIHDKEQPDLQLLPTNDPKLPADSDIPGFPEFIPGERGVLPPEPPYPGVRSPTAEERAALGDDIVPGAPYADTCLKEDVERTIEYTVVALDADIVYNDSGDHDPEGEVFVLEEDAEAVKNGEMNPEPFVIRANVGDCIELTLKNELEAEEGEEREKSLHPHFVRYDLQGSDSLDMGYNYEETVEPGGEQRYRWFANEEGTIFFHDHATGIPSAMNGTFASIIVEPRGSEWLDPHSGEPIRSGTQAIIKRPNGEDFREVALLFHDFAQLVDRSGDFVEPAIQHNQNAGVMAINYRNAPYYHRDDADPAYLHSSFVHGDPETPVFEAYEDDPIRLRLVMGPWEEQHSFHMHGIKEEIVQADAGDPTGQAMNVSEAFTFHRSSRRDFEKLANPTGVDVRDYLFGSTIMDDIWNGMWGLFRVWGSKVDHLRPLPDRGAPTGKISNAKLRQMGHPATFSEHDWTEYGHKAKLLYGENDDRAFPPDKDARKNPSVTGSPPPTAPSPGNPCPAGAPVRRYEVTALQTDIQYNDYGDHDPHGIVFALDEHVDDIKEGKRHPEPLTIRANEGECVEVRLTNALPEQLDDDHPDPEMRAEREWTPSSRVSLHPTRIAHDVQGSDGATVGFNFDQTVAPGESITYRWYAAEETDGCILWDYADLRGHRHHGAFGQLIVEPEGSEWLDPRTGEPIEAGSQALIKCPRGEDFREFALSFADGQYIVNKNDPDECVIPRNLDDDDQDPTKACTQVGDPEDQGYVGINNRSEPFKYRFENNDAQHLVFSSKVHGDPNTPVLNAVCNDPVVFRTALTADKPRGLTFHLANHDWERFRGVEDGAVPTPKIGVEGDYAPGKCHNVEPLGGAGGLEEQTGDFLYQAMKLRRRLEAGWWGIFRVRNHLDEFTDCVQPLPDRAKGLALEDRPGWIVATGTLCTSGAEHLIGGDERGNDTEATLVVVPDSAVGDAAAYLFLGPADPTTITDLAAADARAVLEREDGRVKVRVTVAESADVDAAGLLELLRNTTFTVRDCGDAAEQFGSLGADALGRLPLDVRFADESDERTDGTAVAVEDWCVTTDGSLRITLRDGTAVIVQGCNVG